MGRGRGGGRRGRGGGQGKKGGEWRGRERQVRIIKLRINSTAAYYKVRYLQHKIDIKSKANRHQRGRELVYLQVNIYRACTQLQ